MVWATEQIHKHRNPKAVNYTDTLSSAKEALEPDGRLGESTNSGLPCSHTLSWESGCGGAWAAPLLAGLVEPSFIAYQSSSSVIQPELPSGVTLGHMWLKLV